MSILNISNLSYSYPDKTVALHQINLSINHKKVAILGANGSGKSTLLQHFNGLIIPQHGEVFIKNLAVTKSNLRDIRKQVGIVFDSPDSQLFSTTVNEDIAFGPRNLGLSEEEIKIRVDKAVELVGLQNLRDKTPFNLSLGQKKKAAIAGVLAMNPEIMVFDEPFSGMDPYSLGQLLKILEILCEKNHTLIIATHDLDIAYGWAEEFIILHEGMVLAQGGTELLEDRSLMHKANLTLPIIRKVFDETPIKAKTPEEGNIVLKRLLSQTLI